MEKTKKIIIAPVTETVVVGYKAEPVYAFDELPESVRQSLIENFDREALEDDFFDFSIDFVVDDLMDAIYKKYRLPVTRIPYDLSYCQGSGATFVTDTITGNELKKFIKTTFPAFAKSFRWPGLLDYFCENGIISFLECGSYSGYPCNTLHDEFWFNPDEYPRIDKYLDNKVAEFEELLDDFSNDLSGKIYRTLDICYDGATNDEAVIHELQEHYYNADGFIMDDFIKEVPADV